MGWRGEREERENENVGMFVHTHSGHPESRKQENDLELGWVHIRQRPRLRDLGVLLLPQVIGNPAVSGHLATVLPVCQLVATVTGLVTGCLASRVLAAIQAEGSDSLGQDQSILGRFNFMFQSGNW